jgi:hypothetical protein
MRIRFRSRRRDPYWDVDGRAARTHRRRRRFVGAIVIELSATILGLTVARLPSVDATALVTGPTQVLMLASLAGDVIACSLIFARELRRGRALRRYGELSVLDA